ncbi:MAG: tetratricopeptide repeat protein [Acidobacteriota bacterium]
MRTAYGSAMVWPEVPSCGRHLDAGKMPALPAKTLEQHRTELAKGWASVLLLSLLVVLPSAAVAEVPIPQPQLEKLEAGVRQRLSAAYEALVSAVAAPEVGPAAESAERGKLYGHTGKIFQAHHVFPVAEACYQNAAALDSEELLWPYLLGFIYEDTARLPAAAAQYRRVLELEPAHPLAQLRLGRIRLEQGEVEEAEALLLAVAEVTELAGPLRAALGKIATAREAHEAAAQHYEAALAAQPQASQLHYPLALAYRRLGQVDKAREHAAQGGTAKVVVPDSILAEVGSLSVSSQMFLTSGAQALKAKRFDLAEKAFRGAIAANPDNKRGHLNLSVVLARRGDYSAAEASAREALRLDPAYGFAYFSLGTIHEAREQLGEAMAFYEKTLERLPRHREANLRLANAAMRTGDYERAAERYRTVVEVSPSFVRARFLESMALIALVRYPAARQVLEEAVKIQPGNPELSRTLARLLATVDPPDPAAAARAFELARALGQESAEDIETLAMALAAVGRFADAAAAQQAVLDAARGQAAPDIVRHLEYNLERYRQEQPSDRPWPVENGAD